MPAKDSTRNKGLIKNGKKKGTAVKGQNVYCADSSVNVMKIGALNSV